MDNLIREDYVLGNKKIVVGDNLHDLVLENLGKIWIRYGNGYKEFSQFISTLTKATSDGSKVVIEYNGLKDPETYKSGSLVFEARKKNLYLKFDDDLLLLLEYNDSISEKYVAKAGDTMTGPLTINVKDLAPLVVLSRKLVDNLNAQFLSGKGIDEFALRKEDEEIEGDWTFRGHNIHHGKNEFNNEVIINGPLQENSTSEFNGKSTFNREIEVAGTATFKNPNTAIKVGTGDIVTDGSIGSSQFMSGMTGYGWRLDSETNTLTIDNLIVRGVLNVFELVVNKISATNGSFWITDSFKIDNVHNVVYLRNTDFLNYTNSEGTAITVNITEYFLNNRFNKDDYYIPITNNYTDVTVNGSLTDHPFATRNSKNDSTKTFTKLNWIFGILNLEEFVRIFASNEMSISSLFTTAGLKQLASEGVIQLDHVFQKNIESTVEMELILESSFYTYPDGWDELTSQLFTVITAQNVLLVDNHYVFDESDLSRINLYYKYFGSNLTDGMNLYVLESDHNEYPVFKLGDIIKCLKFTGNSVKQYHGLVIGFIGSYSFIVQLLNSSIVQEGITYEYNSEGELQTSNIFLDSSLYDRSQGLESSLQSLIAQATDLLLKYPEDLTIDYEWCLQVLISPDENYLTYKTAIDNAVDIDNEIQNVLEHSISGLSYEQIQTHPIFKKLLEEKTLGTPEKEDSLVRIGSIIQGDRRNSMYLTSSELNSPYTDVLTNVNRPDYTVVYLTPKYLKIDATKTNKKGTYYVLNTTFGNIMEHNSENDIANANDKLIYRKYKSKSIKMDMLESGETNYDKTSVKLTFLPDEHTLHNLDGSLMKQTVQSIDYFVTDRNSPIVNINMTNTDVESHKENNITTLIIGGENV